LAASDGSFFAELKRRNVYRVGLAYVVASWLLLQVIDVVEPIIGMPDWVAKFVLVVLAVGLPLALVFSWAYEMTPEGLKREKEVDRSASITPQTGRRLDRLIVGILVVAVGLMAIDQYALREQDETVTASPSEPVGQAEEADPAIGEMDVPSIAVLPFMNMSADESSIYFSDGLADTLLHMLAQIREIRVAARTSSFQFRDQNTDITKIADALNVGTVLEGSVQKAGKRIRVTAQLIEAETGYHLWSGNFDRDLDDIFAIQDEIASEVVSALKVSLLGESSKKLTQHDTDNVAAYTEYLLAINDMNQYSFESMRRAEQRFLNALDADPGYAEAWARLGKLYLDMDFFGAGEFRAMNEKAQEAASKAMDLEPESATAIAVLAGVEINIGDIEMAEALFKRAIELAPNESAARVGLARLLIRRNDRHEAIELLDEALTRDPLSPNVHRLLSDQHRILGDYDTAIDHLRRIRDIEPDSPLAWYAEASLEFERGNWARALLQYQRAHELDPDDPEIASDIGDYYLTLGMPVEARRWYDRSAEIDPAHSVARSAPLSLYLYERKTSPEGPALARQLLDENMAARQNSRQLVLQTLWREAEHNGNWDDALTLLRDHFPEYFEPEGDWSHRSLSTTWYLGAMLYAAGREDHAMRIMQPLLDNSTEYRRRFRLGWFHTWNLAATGQRDELLPALTELRQLGRAPDNWPVFVVRLPAFDFVREEPEFQELVEWLEAHSAEQREVLKELLSKDRAELAL
jgi:TolB-like protein/cytochrome c-type biogenesis protein CcmH/NrfG